MRTLCGAVVVLMAAVAIVGCGSNAKPDNTDQVNKVQALQKKSEDSMAKDGIKSER